MKIPSLDRLGKPGIVGLGLLLFCLSFYLGNIVPARQELERLNGEATRLSGAARSGERNEARESEAPRRLPSFATATDSLKELSALAERHGLNIERSTYLLSEQDGRRRLEVNLPLKAGYGSLRGYLRDVLALPSAPVIDELVLQRQKAGDEIVEANIRLSYYFLPAT